MATNNASDGVVEESRGSFDLHTLRWTVGIGVMPTFIARGGDRTFASYSTSFGSYQLKLKLKLSESASTKLLWHNVSFHVEVRSDAPAPVAHSDSTKEGGNGLVRSVDAVDGEVQVSVWDETYAQAKRALFPSSESQTWEFEPSLALHPPQPETVSVQFRMFKRQSKPTTTPTMIESAITNTISLIDTELVHDVLFIVDSSPERPLFGSKSALSAACPYFKVMFESGFKESKSTEDYAGASEDEEEPYIAGSILKLVDEASQELRLARYFSADGSDEDTPISKKRKLLAGQDEEAASHYTRILIEDTTYEAFRALLVYLATGDIYFEPLLSQIGQEAFDSFHAKYEIDHPDKPKPVSPLSMYRLAHRYELDDLRARCLVQLNRSLVDSKLVREAFSEECFLYTEIKDVVHKRMASSWLSIQKSKEWIDTMKQIEAGALPYSSTLLASFMLRKASEPAQTGFQRRYY